MGTCIIFSIYFADFSKCASEYFLSRIDLPYTPLVKHVLWMKRATIIKVCSFYMPCLNVFFNMLFALLFCQHRCRTSSLNVLDATSVARTQARLRRT